MQGIVLGMTGSGKTTLLKIIAGVEQPDFGTCTVAKACKLAYVSQIPTLDPEETLPLTSDQLSLLIDGVGGCRSNDGGPAVGWMIAATD